jgi:hypothetical protein
MDRAKYIGVRIGLTLLVAWEEGKPIPVPGQLAGGKVIVVHHPILTKSGSGRFSGPIQ